MALCSQINRHHIHVTILHYELNKDSNLWDCSAAMGGILWQLWQKVRIDQVQSL